MSRKDDSGGGVGREEQEGRSRKGGVGHGRSRKGDAGWSRERGVGHGRRKDDAEEEQAKGGNDAAREVMGEQSTNNE